MEFAIIAPVLALLLLGAFDTAHTLYMRGVLQGVVQKTARDSALESGTGADEAATTVIQNQIDDKVRAQVHVLANNATITITRRFYRTFSDAAAARPKNIPTPTKMARVTTASRMMTTNHNLGWDAMVAMTARAAPRIGRSIPSLSAIRASSRSTI